MTMAINFEIEGEFEQITEFKSIHKRCRRKNFSLRSYSSFLNCSTSKAPSVHC